jgi:transposase-like protein
VERTTRSYSYSIEIIRSALRGYNAGFPQRDISVVLGVPRTTLREWIYEYRSGKLDAEDSPEHYHYWFIPPPNGKDMITGTCRICFERKEFLNVFPENSNWVRLV